MKDHHSSRPILRCVSPVDGRVVAERPCAEDADVRRALETARSAQRAWRDTGLAERTAVCERFVAAFVAKRDAIAEEITWQMGRPLRDSPGEVSGFEERARYMIGVAEEALADVDPGTKRGFRRVIRREPLGVVFVIAPWNYPYLTAVNAVVPAVLSGNAVILKHSEQTLLCAERLSDAFQEAGLPLGVFQFLHLTHEQSGRLIVSEGGPEFVAFTGSVEGGAAVQKAAATRTDRLVGVGLELGGKDPAYVRADADLGFTVPNLVEGAFYNAGQSCCAVERIYVHDAVYERFVERYVAGVEELRLGDPLDPETTLGPVVRTRNAVAVWEQVLEAVAAGARALVDTSFFPRHRVGSPYLAPQVLTHVSHGMRIMTEETFGPAVGIMKVSSDEEALRLMNDSAYGLTASIWTQEEDSAFDLAARIETGTVFMNRCDYLDPALAWTGVKASGRGVSLSRLGYEQLTQPKSYHFRTKRPRR